MTTSITFTVFERKGRQGWWYQFVEDGERSSILSVAALARTASLEALPLNTKRQAQRVVRDAIAKGFVGKGKHSAKGDLIEYLTDYWNFDGQRIRRRNRLKPGSVSPYYASIMGGYIRNHIAHRIEGLRLAEVTAYVVDDVRNQLIDEGVLANATIAKIMTAFTMPLIDAYRSSAIEEDPTRLLDPMGTEPERKRGVFEREEMQALLRVMNESADERVYLAVLLAAATGMRQGEIRALCKEDIWLIDEDNALVNIRHSWSAKGGQKSTKGKKERMAPIPRWVAERLIELADKDKHKGKLVFWSTHKGVPISANFLRTELYKHLYSVLAEQGGFSPTDTIEVGGKKILRSEVVRRERNLVFHSFRHFFATEAQALGADAEVLRRTVGHESQKMTDQYTHESFDLVKPMARIAAEIAGSEEGE